MFVPPSPLSPSLSLSAAALGHGLMKGTDRHGTAEGSTSLIISSRYLILLSTYVPSLLSSPPLAWIRTRDAELGVDRRLASESRLFHSFSSVPIPSTHPVPVPVPHRRRKSSRRAGRTPLPLPLHIANTPTSRLAPHAAFSGQVHRCAHPADSG